MPVIYSNNASTTLSAGINDSTTTIAIASASGFPSIGSGEYYFATIANTNNTKIEVVKVTAGTTSLTVTRAQDGTTAQAFDSGDNFQLRVTSATLEAATKTDVNITAGAIAGAAISNDAIDSQHYANGSIDTAHIGDLQVTTAKIGADAITSAKIADDSIDSEHIVDGSIDTAHIGDDQVTADKLANSINTEIAANTAKVTNATHTGEVTGATALTIADNVVDEANLKVSNTPTNGYFLSAQSGNTGGLTWAEVDTTIADGAISTAKLAADAVTGAKIADDVIDSEHIAAGAIDLEHLSSESVDEDNLYISNAGSNGQFLQKQSGNNGGLTWATVSSEDYIPDGSVMVFFQANAPTGWTKVTTQNDKTLRVVSGTGGGTGGDWAMSAGETTSSHGGHVHAGAAHNHSHNLSAGSHTLSVSQMPSHSHSSGINGQSSNAVSQSPQTRGGNNPINTGSTGGSGSHSHSLSGSISSGGDGNTSSAGSHTHTIAAPQYIDVIICSKDAQEIICQH